MPTPRQFNRSKLPPTVWNLIETEVRKRTEAGQRIHALHVGDTYLPFPQELTTPVSDEDVRYPSLINRYTNTYGDLPLREILLAKVRDVNRLPAGSIDSIQVTAGSTGALQAGFARLLEPGSEILTLAPYWTILRQVADHSGVRLVEVPFFDQLPNASSAHLRPTGTDELDVASHLGKYLSDKTRAIYLNTPSNPTGMLLGRALLEQIASFAIEHDLWVFSDEAYEDFIWESGEHISIGSLPGMFERTISCYTMSKCFGVSGIRVGYLAAEPSVTSNLNRAVVGGYYHAGRIAQLYAWRGMLRFSDAVKSFRRAYEPVWRLVTDNLRCEFLPSVSTFYFWIKLPTGWDQLTSAEQVQKMLDAGVVLAPGEYFGLDYRGWARLCFTSLPPDQTEEAVFRLNQLFS